MDFSKINYTKEQMIKSGNRIRSYCKANKITQYDLMALLEYKCRNVISDCWNGEKMLKPHKYEILSKEWGLRIEYLLGIDDYPTIENYLDEQMKEYDATKKATYMLLLSYGYEIKETNYIYSNDYYYKKNDNNLNDKYKEWTFIDVLEVTTPNGEKTYIRKDQLNNLVGDFFAILQRRLIPCDIVKTHWEKEL